jgi:hypothetical protein
MLLDGETSLPPPPLNFHRFTQNPPDTKKLSLTPPPPIFQILSLRTLLEKSAHYTLHSKTTPFWACPKRRSFGQFLIFVFCFFLRKTLKEKKKKGEIGGGWSHPLAQKWGGRTTPFLAKGWLWPPHVAGMGWPKPPPGLWGWSGHPESHQEKKKKNEMGLCRWGWPDHSLRAWVWS